jgi:hypothetical protein
LKEKIETEIKRKKLCNIVPKDILDLPQQDLLMVLEYFTQQLLNQKLHGEDWDAVLVYLTQILLKDGVSKDLQKAIISFIVVLSEVAPSTNEILLNAGGLNWIVRGIVEKGIVFYNSQK